MSKHIDQEESVLWGVYLNELDAPVYLPPYEKPPRIRELLGDKPKRAPKRTLWGLIVRLISRFLGWWEARYAR